MDCRGFDYPAASERGRTDPEPLWIGTAQYPFGNSAEHALWITAERTGTKLCLCRRFQNILITRLYNITLSMSIVLERGAFIDFT